jgi:peptide/nickel transport system ATP-binding protein
MSGRDDLYATPIHPYTRALLEAVPVPDPRKRRSARTTIRGELGAIPSAGCRFAPRCPLASEQCRHEAPPLTERAPGHRTACWNA